MVEKTLKEKIGWMPGLRVLVAGLPKGLNDPFDGVDHVSVQASSAAPKGKFDVVLGFAADAAALQILAPVILAAVIEDGKLWLCYSKGSSKVKSDLTRDTGWTPMVDAGWRVVAIASLDRTWSAVRFRPNHLVRSTRC